MCGKLGSFFLLALAAFGGALWAAPVGARAKVVITIDLTKSQFSIVKASRLGTQVLNGPIIPVHPGSVHLGQFRMTKTYQKYWTRNGSVTLQNVIRFGHNGIIRSSSMFNEWRASKRPATGSIVVDADLGLILYHTVKTFGPGQTIIHIIR